MNGPFRARTRIGTEKSAEKRRRKGTENFSGTSPTLVEMSYCVPEEPYGAVELLLNGGLLELAVQVGECWRRRLETSDAIRVQELCVGLAKHTECSKCLASR